MDGYYDPEDHFEYADQNNELVSQVYKIDRRSMVCHPAFSERHGCAQHPSTRFAKFARDFC